MNATNSITGKSLAKTILTLALASLIGCSSPALRSRRVTDGNREHAIPGVAYFLPKVMIQIVADQVKTSHGLRTNTTYWMTNLYIDSLVISNGVKIPIINSNTIYGSSSAVVENLVGDTNRYALTINLLTVPDTAHLYSLKLKPSAAANDHYNITVNSSGFLTSVNASNQDRTATIVETLGQTAANIAEAAAGFPPLRGAPPRIKRTGTNELRNEPAVIGNLSNPPPSHFEVLFDPADTNDLYRANMDFRFGTSQLISIGCTPLLSEKCPLDLSTNCGPDKTGGVFYRPALPYLLSIHSVAARANATNFQSLLMAPNQAPVFAVAVHREPFVTVNTSVTFTNGYLASVDYTKPSQIEGFVNIPFELSKLAISLPTNLIQAKINLTSQDTALLKQQQQLVDQQSSLLTSVSNLVRNQARFDEFMRTNK